MRCKTAAPKSVRTVRAMESNVLQNDNKVLRVLFLCTGNSCRSQMAEGFCCARWNGVISAQSAGTRPGTLNRLAVRAMAESGVDIAAHTPKNVESLRGLHFDAVITVCDAAHEACPTFAGAQQVLHHSFDDPPHLAANSASDEEAMVHYRRVRDEIETFIESLPTLLAADSRCGKNRGLHQ